MLERIAKVLGEPSKTMLVVFAAFGTATLQLIRHAPPSPDILEVTPLILGLSFFFGMFVPVGILFAVDRAIGAWDKSGKGQRWYRVGLLSVCGLLVVREMQLYFGPVHNLWSNLAPAPYFVLVLIAFAILAVIIVACARFYEQIEQFCVYLAPVTALMVLITMVQMLPHRVVPDAYGAESTSAGETSGPPVFVIVYDELAYDAVVVDGEIDAEKYPNFAALAEDGVRFDNATSNWFHTTFVLPSLVESIVPLAEDYDIRLYDQYGWVESLYFNGCGNVFTCQGAVKVVEDNPRSLTTDVVLRSFYEATPSVAEDVIEAPMGLLADALGTVLPSVDPRGIHAITEETFDMVLDDIDGDTAAGRIHLVHTMLPHTPFIYDQDGDAATDPDGTTSRTAGPKSAEVYASYLRQIQYADTYLGRLIAKLKDEGIYEESVVLITGDHGLRSKGATPHEPLDIEGATTQVPVIIKAPGLTPGRTTVDYQHIDFGPTLADVLDLPYTGETQGVSAFSEKRPDRDKVFYVDDNNEIYWKYVYDEAADEWVLTETVEGKLRDYQENAVVQAPDDAPEHTD